MFSVMGLEESSLAVPSASSSPPGGSTSHTASSEGSPPVVCLSDSDDSSSSVEILPTPIEVITISSSSEAGTRSSYSNDGSRSSFSNEETRSSFSEEVITLSSSASSESESYATSVPEGGAHSEQDDLTDFEIPDEDELRAWADLFPSPKMLPEDLPVSDRDAMAWLDGIPTPESVPSSPVAAPPSPVPVLAQPGPSRPPVIVIDPRQIHLYEINKTRVILGTLIRCMIPPERITKILEHLRQPCEPNSDPDRISISELPKRQSANDEDDDSQSTQPLSEPSISPFLEIMRNPSLWFDSNDGEEIDDENPFPPSMIASNIKGPDAAWGSTSRISTKPAEVPIEDKYSEQENVELNTPMFPTAIETQDSGVVEESVEDVPMQVDVEEPVEDVPMQVDVEESVEDVPMQVVVEDLIEEVSVSAVAPNPIHNPFEDLEFSSRFNSRRGGNIDGSPANTIKVKRAKPSSRSEGVPDFSWIEWE